MTRSALPPLSLDDLAAMELALADLEAVAVAKSCYPKLISLIDKFRSVLRYERERIEDRPPRPLAAR